MKALWWFEDNAIAGMARPGFNAAHWNELSLEESFLLGWLGQYSSGPQPLSSFRLHLQTYAPKVISIFKVDRETGERALSLLNTEIGLMHVMHSLAKRTRALEDFGIQNEFCHFSVSKTRIGEEIEHLRDLGVRRIISLTEQHHQKELLADHFKLHHLGIADFGPPTAEQVHHLAEIFKATRRNKEIVAVHCLAGIGRTSTMLLASHLILGDNFDKLKMLIGDRNPTFELLGAQADFIHGLAK